MRSAARRGGGSGVNGSGENQIDPAGAEGAFGQDERAIERAVLGKPHIAFVDEPVFGVEGAEDG